MSIENKEYLMSNVLSVVKELRKDYQKYSKTTWEVFLREMKSAKKIIQLGDDHFNEWLIETSSGTMLIKEERKQKIPRRSHIYYNDNLIGSVISDDFFVLIFSNIYADWLEQKDIPEVGNYINFLKKL